MQIQNWSQIAYTKRSSSFFFRSEVTEATLNHDVPSENESVARRVINETNRSMDDLRTDVGILSIINDLAGSYESTC